MEIRDKKKQTIDCKQVTIKITYIAGAGSFWRFYDAMQEAIKGIGGEFEEQPVKPRKMGLTYDGYKFSATKPKLVKRVIGWWSVFLEEN